MYRGYELFPYVIFLLVGLPADCVLFYVSAGTALKIMGFYYSFAMAKFFYVYRRDEKRLLS